MMFVAYVDESDTQGPAPNVFSIANLATAKNWELFERRFRGLKREFGFRVLHGVEFKGWPFQKHQDFFNRFGDLHEEYLTESFSVACEHAVYKQHILDARPKKMHAISQYGVCFQALMYGLVVKVLEHKRSNPKL